METLYMHELSGVPSMNALKVPPKVKTPQKSPPNKTSPVKSSLKEVKTEEESVQKKRKSPDATPEPVPQKRKVPEVDYSIVKAEISARSNRRSATYIAPSKIPKKATRKNDRGVLVTDQVTQTLMITVEQEANESEFLPEIKKSKNSILRIYRPKKKESTSGLTRDIGCQTKSLVLEGKPYGPIRWDDPDVPCTDMSSTFVAGLMRSNAKFIRNKTKRVNVRINESGLKTVAATILRDHPLRLMVEQMKKSDQYGYFYNPVKFEETIQKYRRMIKT